jgi:hypothetical protein
MSWLEFLNQQVSWIKEKASNETRSLTIVYATNCLSGLVYYGEGTIELVGADLVGSCSRFKNTDKYIDSTETYQPFDPKKRHTEKIYIKVASGEVQIGTLSFKDNQLLTRSSAMIGESHAAGIVLDVGILLSLHHASSYIPS